MLVLLNKLETQRGVQKSYEKKLKRTLKRIRNEEDDKRKAIESEYKYFNLMRNSYLGYPSYNPYHYRSYF